MVMVICICLNYFVILIYCIFFHKASRKQHVLQFAIEMEDLTLVKLLCDGGANVNILVLVHDYFVVSLLISKRDNLSLEWLQYSYNMSIKCLIQAWKSKLIHMPSLAARNIERARKIDCISWILELSHLFTLFVDCVSYTLSKLIVTLGYNEDEHYHCHWMLGR